MWRHWGWHTHTSSLAFFSLPISFLNWVNSFSLCSSWASSCRISSLRKRVSGPVPSCWAVWIGNKTTRKLKTTPTKKPLSLSPPLSVYTPNIRIRCLQEALILFLCKLKYWGWIFIIINKLSKWKQWSSWNWIQMLWACMELAVIFLCAVTTADPIVARVTLSDWLKNLALLPEVNRHEKWFQVTCITNL